MKGLVIEAKLLTKPESEKAIQLSSCNPIQFHSFPVRRVLVAPIAVQTFQLWALYYTGPFLGPSAKTAHSRKAMLFNKQILAEAELGLIWTDQT